LYEIDLSHVVRLGPRRVRIQLPVTLSTGEVIDIAWSNELTDELMWVDTTETYRVGQNVEVAFVDDEERTWTLKAQVSRLAVRQGVCLSFHDLDRDQRLGLVVFIARTVAKAETANHDLADVAVARV